MVGVETQNTRATVKSTGCQRDDDAVILISALIGVFSYLNNDHCLDRDYRGSRSKGGLSAAQHRGLSSRTRGQTRLLSKQFGVLRLILEEGFHIHQPFGISEGKRLDRIGVQDAHEALLILLHSIHGKILQCIGHSPLILALRNKMMWQRASPCQALLRAIETPARQTETATEEAKLRNSTTEEPTNGSLTTHRIGSSLSSRFEFEDLRHLLRGSLLHETTCTVCGCTSTSYATDFLILEVPVDRDGCRGEMIRAGAFQSVALLDLLKAEYLHPTEVDAVDCPCCYVDVLMQQIVERNGKQESSGLLKLNCNQSCSDNFTVNMRDGQPQIFQNGKTAGGSSSAACNQTVSATGGSLPSCFSQSTLLHFNSKSAANLLRELQCAKHQLLQLKTPWEIVVKSFPTLQHSIATTPVTKTTKSNLLSIQSLPLCLILHIQRYRWAPLNNYSKKIFTHVKFPFLLNLDSLVARPDKSAFPQLYELRAITEHIGKCRDREAQMLCFVVLENDGSCDARFATRVCISLLIFLVCLLARYFY